MIKSIEINRFRGIKQLRLDDLRMINIVVGPSATGKTALLEGLRLALGATPQVAYNLALRGIPNFLFPNPSREQFESLWSPLFFDFAINESVEFHVVNSDGDQAKSEIYFDESKAVIAAPVPVPNTGSMPGASAGHAMAASAIAPIAFKRKAFDGSESTLRAAVGPNGQLNFDQGPDLAPTIDFLTPVWQSNPQLVAITFSRLSVENTEKDVVQTLRQQFPEIQEISVQSPTLFPVLYAGLSQRARKMPLALVSSGISKFISLLLAIEGGKGGVLLVDEIENGIYYQTMPALLEALHSAARRMGVQLFLTTHSWECLKGAVPQIEKFPQDFNLIQMYQDHGQSVAKVVPGDRAAAAIEAEIEVRA